MKRIISFIFILLISCASKNEGLYKRVSVEQYYRQSGVVKYIHPVIPAWANSSETANCQRIYQVHYFNIKSVMQSHGLSFENALQAQYTYNFLYQNALFLNNVQITPKEEEQLFFQAVDKVKAGVKNFRKPTFKRVNAVWVDSFSRKNLKNLMSSSDMMEGRPLLISMCKTQLNLKRYLSSIGVSTDGVRLLTYEMMSYYKRNGELGAREELDLGAFKTKEQTYYLYYEGQKPQNIIGSFKYRKY